MLLSLAVVAIALPNRVASAALPHADSVLLNAMEASDKTKRPMFIAFGASDDAFGKGLKETLDDPKVKVVLDRHVVTRWLYVNPTGRGMQNPGAGSHMYEQSGNQKVGAPFWFFAKSDGKHISDAFMRKGRNCGCPWTPDEIQHFSEAFQKAAPKAKPSEIKVLTDAFARLQKKYPRAVPQMSAIGRHHLGGVRGYQTM